MDMLEMLKSSILDMSHFVASHPGYAVMGAGVGFILFARTYAKLTCGMCRCDDSMAGKIVIITGSNAGIGKETARELAKRGAKVIVASRNLEKGQQAVAELIKSTGNKDIIFRQLDLASFESVKNFAKIVLETERRLDVLINNAGIYGSSKKVVTVDGCEEVIQSNHLGHFLLTKLLLDLIKQSTPSRIINVSSGAYLRGEKNWTDMNSNLKYSSFDAYAKSKIANILFTQELAKRLEGTGVTVNCLHPGIVKTGILKCYTVGEIVIRILFFLVGKTPLEGAQTSIHLASSKKLETVSGKYFYNCKEEPLEPVALDEESASTLWLMSERIVGL